MTTNMHIPSRISLICVGAVSATACVRPLTPMIPVPAAPVAAERGGPVVTVDVEDPADSVAISLNGVLVHRGGLYDDPPSLKQHLRSGRNEVGLTMTMRYDSVRRAIEKLERQSQIDSSSGRSYRTVDKEYRVALTAAVWGCTSSDIDCAPPVEMPEQLPDGSSQGTGTTGAVLAGTTTLTVNGEQANAGESGDVQALEAAIRRLLRGGRNEVVIQRTLDARALAQQDPGLFDTPYALMLAAFGATNRQVTFTAVVTSERTALEVCAAGDVSCSKH